MGSVRGERTIYRERDTDYDEAPRRSYTTVKRYQVPESITRSVYNDDDDVVKEKITIKRERREDPPPERDNIEYRVRERVREREPPSREREEIDIRVSEREREREPPRRDVTYRVVERDRSRSRPRSEFREVIRERSAVRAPSPPVEDRVREFRFERERSFSRERERDRDYDVERYSKSTEYFSQPQPQPIIIRESAPAPIIIREERRQPQPIVIRREEPQYEFIERKEVVEEARSEVKSLVKREEPPPPTPVQEQKPEEDYFYERRVVERRRRSNSDDRRTEIKPRDSASQYSSDDSYEYIRRERTTEGGREHSPHHKRHLAEGAIAGIGAAEIIRHHRKSKGENPGGRGKSVIGGAAVGALGAEAISRVRSMRSLRSRSRSRSEERYDRKDRRKRRSRSRSKSMSRAQQLGGLAAVAAVGALAGYALKNRGNKETVIVNDRPHRSRSRRRRGSVDSYYDEGRVRDESKHRDPGYRNRRIAQAGLASAAAAGIWEKVRSRSRGARSKSRIRQGVPIAAAGLGGAALAGLYEKNKANKEAQRDAVIEDEMHRGRRRRSRSRSRSAPAPYPGNDRRGVDDQGLVAYGHEPIYPDARHDRYSDEEPGSYRRRGGSSGSSPDTRRRRSRSRGHELAEPALAAGIAAGAAHEMTKRSERSRADRQRRYPEDDRYDRYSDAPYSPPPMGNHQFLPPQQSAYAPQPQQAYPGNTFFPPPPTGDYARNEPYAEPNAGGYQAYNPQDYAGHPSGQQQPYNASHGAYGDSDAHLGQGYPTDTFAGDPRYGAPDHQQHAGAADGRRGRDNPENVSPLPVESHEDRRSHSADGVDTPRRPRSTSRVRFDLDSNITHSPDASRRKDDAKRGPTEEPSGAREHARQNDDDDNDDDNDDDGNRIGRRRRRKGKERARDRSDLMHDHYEHSPDRASDDTVDLPSRFDENGNRKHQDPLTEKINDLLSGKGGAGGLFKSLTEGLMGGGGGGSEGDRDGDGHSGRRRHRR